MSPFAYSFALALAALTTFVAASIVIYIAISRTNRKIQNILDLLHARNAADRGASLAVTAATVDFRLRPLTRAALKELRRSGARAQDSWIYSLDYLIRTIEPVASETNAATKVVVCSVALGDSYRDIVAPCLESHAAYARRHGYRYCLLDRLPPHVARPAAWMKIPLIAKLLSQGHDHVMYIDADAMITRFDLGIDRHLADLDTSGACLLLTEDGACANSGVMFFRNCPAAKALLELVWSYDADIEQGTWEQFALNVLLENFPEVRRNILIEADPKAFNSFPQERESFHRTRPQNIWSQGDFICHFSGIRPPHLKDIIETYAAKVGPMTSR